MTRWILALVFVVSSISADSDRLHELDDHLHEGEKHDEHDADIAILGAEHEHLSSLVKQCEAKEGLYCYDPSHATTADSCFTGADKTTRYCLCTDTEAGDAGGAKISWNGTACKSTARDECFWKKENYFSFYKGVCYTEKECEKLSKVDFPVTWKGGNHATCAHLQARCAKLDDAKWDDTKKVCTCTEEGAEFHGDHCHAEEKVVSNSAKWGYGIIATALISAFAVIGVLIVLLRHQWWYSHLLATMVALAMGCLLSDATLHLIPLSLGLHSHDDEGDGHAHGEAKEEMSGTQRRNITIAITAGVYLFLLFEKLIHIVIPHQHSHGGEVHGNPAADTEMKESKLTSVNEVEDEEMSNTKPRCTKRRSFVDHLHEEDVITRDGSICSVDSVAWMVIVGDALHNFADGLVMGAAFTNSLATGLGTSIAVFCHEVPHELGDFAVLLNAGMKIKFAVLFNFLSACTCFLGLFVGLAIGSNEDAQKWIFAFTAGMFIYIACADLIPLMNTQARASKHPTTTLILQHVGMIVGFLIMWLLALYEETISQIGKPHDH